MAQHFVEVGEDGPIYSATTFSATILSCCKSLVQTGLQRVSANEVKPEPQQKQAREVAVELLSKESHATASLISKCCPPQL